jgi:hypothetical protein
VGTTEPNILRRVGIDFRRRARRIILIVTWWAFGQIEAVANQRALEGGRNVKSKTSPTHLTLVTKNRPLCRQRQKECLTIFEALRSMEL